MATSTAPPGTPNLPIPTTSTPTPAFTFPPHHSFPPFYTLQPNHALQLRQLTLWSTLTALYCSSQHIFTLALSTAPSLPLFANARISRSLDALAVRKVLDYMSTREAGRVIEWMDVAGGRRRGGGGGGSGGRELKDEDKVLAWVWWRRPEEWAEVVYKWVEGTGQKGSVLTLYELREGGEEGGREWVGMGEDMLRTCLDVLVKKGRAQVFESQGGDGGGVKFF